MRRFFGCLILAIVVSLWVVDVGFGQLGAAISNPGWVNAYAPVDSEGDFDPQIATDGAGNWLCIWATRNNVGGSSGADHDILMSRSQDNGISWSPPIPVNTNATTDSGDDSRPAIAFGSGGVWLAVWNSGENLGGGIGTDDDLLFATSTNAGTTWSAPQVLNTNANLDTGNDRVPAVATDGAGNWVVAWRSDDSLGSTIGNDSDILVTYSTDNGATWAAPAALNSNATMDSGLDQGVELATDGQGTWVAVWQTPDNLNGTIGDDEDCLFSVSTDNGQTWSTAAPLNSNATTDTGDDTGPFVQTDGAGVWVAVWRSTENLGGQLGTDADVLFARSLNNGASWSLPTALNSNAPGENGFDGDPMVISDGVGNWIAIWESRENLGGNIGEDEDIMVARSSNNGVSWNGQQVLNNNAALDAESDCFPRLATDRMGRWVAVWPSDDPLGGLLGTDADVLTARFLIPVSSGGACCGAVGLSGLVFGLLGCGALMLASRRRN